MKKGSRLIKKIRPYKKIFSFYFFFLLVSLFLFRCNFSETVKVDIGLPPFQKLSEYNFFKGNLKDLLPRERVLPYDLITPLFSDYAAKERFIWVPVGQKATYNDSSVFDFPDGTALVKNFYYPDDFRDEKKGRRIIETRLLIKRKEGWDALPYIWNDEQTEAYLEIAGGKKHISWIDKSGDKIELDYSIPNKNQCKGCHAGEGKFLPIGPKARYLNHSFIYSDGGQNQLEKWSEAGILQAFSSPEKSPRIAKWDDPRSGTPEQRALAYLEVNCAHCHSRSGPAATSGLFLTTTEKNSSHLGICKSPVAAGKGTGGLQYDIVPGKPEASILLYRMISLDPGVMMPETGRSLVHKEGVELVRQWIASLEGDCRVREEKN